MVRVVLGGEGLAGFQATDATDQHDNVRSSRRAPVRGAVRRRRGGAGAPGHRPVGRRSRSARGVRRRGRWRSTSWCTATSASPDGGPSTPPSAISSSSSDRRGATRRARRATGTSWSATRRALPAIAASLERAPPLRRQSRRVSDPSRRLVGPPRPDKPGQLADLLVVLSASARTRRGDLVGRDRRQRGRRPRAAGAPPPGACHGSTVGRHPPERLGVGPTGGRVVDHHPAQHVPVGQVRRRRRCQWVGRHGRDVRWARSSRPGYGASLRSPRRGALITLSATTTAMTR